MGEEREVIERITCSYRDSPSPLELYENSRGGGISRIDFLKDRLKRSLLEEIEKRGLLEFSMIEHSGLRGVTEISISIQVKRPENHGNPIWQKISNQI